MWNSAFLASGINAVYLPFQVKPDSLHMAFAGMQALNICGVNVTRPHKQAAAGLCKKLEAPADTLGAVNTVQIFPDGLHGHNTDATGFLRLLQDIAPAQNALVLGNGGAAAAVLWALGQAGQPSITQISRSENHRPLFLRPDCVFTGYEWTSESMIEALEKCDLVINTTPLGWNSKDNLAEFETKLSKKHSFIDLNYSLNSRLMICAQQKCGKVMDGRVPLLFQALEAFKILTGLEAPEKIMQASLF